MCTEKNSKQRQPGASFLVGSEAQPAIIILYYIYLPTSNIVPILPADLAFSLDPQHQSQVQCRWERTFVE